MSPRRTTKMLGVDGTRLTLDGKPFYWQGLAFFNAVYNPTFNQSAEERLRWLRKLKANGISALRVKVQWSYPPHRAFVDAAPHHTMYTDDGGIREESFANLVALIEALDSLDMVLEISMFDASIEPYFLAIPVQERAVRELTERLRPYGNVLQQILSETSLQVMRYYEILREADPDRLVTSAPGVSNDLGDDEQNEAYDILTPHTLRGQAFPFWYLASGQIEYLLDTYHKPVIDDSPARAGLIQHGGIPGGTTPEQHVLQIRRVRAVGGYHNYSHDMFQHGYGHPNTPPNGIPDPDFSPFHRKVFDYLRDHPTW